MSSAVPTANRTCQTTAAPSSAAAELGGLPWIEEADTVAPRDARDLSKLFFARLHSLEEGTTEYQYARSTLIEMNLSLVRFAAGRFRNHGDGAMEDIVQVGTIGLIKAIDRFDLSREVEFTSFALPTIMGEIKRYFRDNTWAVHVPRRLQELRVDLAKAQEQLATALDRDPTVKELAERLELSEQEVTEGLVAANGYVAGSLDTPRTETTDTPLHGSSRARSLVDGLGDCDPAIELVEDLHALAPLLEKLGERDRRILEMRFGQEMTQLQIAQELGVSQMHVSRLLARTLTELRNGMLTEH